MMNVILMNNKPQNQGVPLVQRSLLKLSVSKTISYHIWDEPRVQAANTS